MDIMAQELKSLSSLIKSLSCLLDSSSTIDQQAKFDELLTNADNALKGALAAEIRAKEANDRALALLAKLDKSNGRCKCCGKH